MSKKKHKKNNVVLHQENNQAPNANKQMGINNQNMPKDKGQSANPKSYNTKNENSNKSSFNPTPYRITVNEKYNDKKEFAAYINMGSSNFYNTIIHILGSIGISLKVSRLDWNSPAGSVEDLRWREEEAVVQEDNLHRFLRILSDIVEKGTCENCQTDIKSKLSPFSETPCPSLSSP